MKYGKTQDKKQQHFADFSFAKNRAFYISGFALLCLWLTCCWQGLTTVVEIWYGNEIFNHGFFIVPGAIYLIYLKRYELLSKPIQTSTLSLSVIIPALLLYVIGIAGNIQLFLHAATFTLLPALIWLLIGTKAAKSILFPLVFMLFSIPVGEQLIPYLQEIAADGSVALLHLTGVPLFRSGLYIEIPQGRFLVAEACSGISFFIASFVIGSLYAYLNLVSAKRRAVFVAISLIFPVLANIVRVYGIILIAYWTDMEHAAGADHLIYGWFFFAFVIVCLLGIGELMRDSQLNANKFTYATRSSAHSSPAVIVVTSSLFFVVITWSKSIGSIENKKEGPSYVLQFPSKICDSPSFALGPQFIKPTFQKSSAFAVNALCGAVVHEAWFNGVDNEIVSDLHRSFDPDKWSLIVKKSRIASIFHGGIQFPVTYLSSPDGQVVSIVSFYVINNNIFTSKVAAKIHEVKVALKGQKVSGGMVVIGAIDSQTLRQILQELKVNPQRRL